MQNHIEQFSMISQTRFHTIGIACHRSILKNDYPLHSHDYIELEWITSGKCKQTINGTEYICNKGDFWILDNSCEHKLQPLDSTVKINNMRILPQCTNSQIQDMLNCQKYPVVGKITFGSITKIQNLFSILCNSLVYNYPDFVIHSLVQTILFLFFNEFDHTLASNGGNNSINYAKEASEYINNNFAEKITLDTAAKAIGISKNYLCSLFSHYFSSSFNKYLNEVRLNYAKHLLANTDMSIIDVAYSSGFHTLSSMNRIFQSKVGMSPTAYKQKKLSSPKK